METKALISGAVNCIAPLFSHMQKALFYDAAHLSIAYHEVTVFIHQGKVEDNWTIIHLHLHHRHLDFKGHMEYFDMVHCLIWLTLNNFFGSFDILNRKITW